MTIGLPGTGVGFDRMFNGSAGMQVNRMLDALGLPDNFGDMIGAQIDMGRGDMKGAMRNLQDLTSGLPTGSMDRIFGKGLAPFGFVPRPLDFIGTRAAFGAGFAAGSAIGAGLGGFGAIARGFSPFGGISREAPFGTGFAGRSIERAARRDPFFKAQLERQLGGTILPDRRNDGRLTIYRPPFSAVGGLMRDAIGGGLLPKIGLAATLAGVGVPLAGALAGNAVAGGILRGLQRMEANMTSFMGGLGGSTGVNTPNPGQGHLANDPETRAMAEGMGVDLRNASFEDILFLLLMKYAKKKEEDVMNKVKQLDQSMQDAKKEGKDGGGKGGLGGALGGILGTAGGVVGNMFAPGIGGAIGGALGQGVGGALGGALQGGGQSTGMYGSELGQNMDPSKMSETMKQQMMQKLMGDLQKLYEMLSNMIKSMHDMQMTPVRNLRG